MGLHSAQCLGESDKWENSSLLCYVSLSSHLLGSRKKQSSLQHRIFLPVNRWLVQTERLTVLTQIQTLDSLLLSYDFSCSLRQQIYEKKKDMISSKGQYHFLPSPPLIQPEEEHSSYNREDIQTHESRLHPKQNFWEVVVGSLALSCSFMRNQTL